MNQCYIKNTEVKERKPEYHFIIFGFLLFLFFLLSFFTLLFIVFIFLNVNFFICCKIILALTHGHIYY